MKKQLLIGLSVFALVFSFATTVKAENSVGVSGSAQINTQGTVRPVKPMLNADLREKIKLNSEAEVETAQKQEMARCAALTDETQRKDCYTKLKIRFDAVRNFVKGTAKDEDIKTLRDGIEKGEWADRIEAMQKKWGERMEVGIKMHAENNLARFEAFYNRLVKISERIDSRISKLKDEGKDVSTSVKYMSAARTDLSEAKTAIASLKSAWNDLINSDADTTVDNSAFEKCKLATGGVILKTFPAKCELDGQTYTDLSVSAKIEGAKDGRFEKLRSIAKTAKEELKSAHKNMMEAVKNLPKSDNTNDKANIQLDTKVEVESR